MTIFKRPVCQMEAAALEPVANSKLKTANRAESGAKSGAPAIESANLTAAAPLLERLLELWPMLSSTVRLHLYRAAFNDNSNDLTRDGSNEGANIEMGTVSPNFNVRIPDQYPIDSDDCGSSGISR